MSRDLKTSTQRQILVVDEDAAVRAALLIGLEDRGWQVWVAADLSGMTHLLDRDSSRDSDWDSNRGSIGLVLLNRRLLGNDETELPRQLNQRDDLPVICYRIAGDSGDSVTLLRNPAGNGLNADLNLVCERLAEVFRKYRKSLVGYDIVVFDQIAFDMRRRVAATQQGQVLDLTETELRILELLLRDPGYAISRDEIYETLHDCERSPLDRTVDGHVARLRRKLVQNGTHPQLIRSVRGIGYVFTGTVHKSKGLTL